MLIPEKLFEYIDESEEDMIKLQEILTAVPALSPDSGGSGETAKAEVLISWLKDSGFKDIEVINAPDSRVPSGKRPNIIVTIPGKSHDKAHWFMTHLDIVPPGEVSLWETDPYMVVRKGDKIYGRGVEDNQQGMVSSIFAALSFLKTGSLPEYDMKLLFLSDEEVGSEYGILYLLKEHSIFGKNDIFIVPDGGSEDGSLIEVAEKSVLWLKFTTKGKQCHASVPQHGKNAFLPGSALVVSLNELNKIFSSVNKIFKPPYSTFMPTKKEANVPNVNTIPGEDVFYIDCRILPSISVDDVLAEIDKMCRNVEDKYQVQINYNIIERVSSVPTSSDCFLVTRLKDCIKKVYGIPGKEVGIGGGTVAAHLRNDGYDAVVWAKFDETAHMPNEYCCIDNMVSDAKVMILMML